MGTTSTRNETSFRLLGPLEVFRGGVLVDVPPGRQQALLATLLLRPNEIVPAHMLVDQVWGDGADRSVLNVCMMRLRRSLHDANHELLRCEGGGYRIAVAVSAVDLHRFRQLCADAARARERGDLETERSSLHTALALWRGEAFSEITSPVIQSEVVPILDDERLNAIQRRIDVDLACGAHAELVPELRELVVAHPFRERFWCQLLLVLCRSGRRSEALETYPRVRQTFAEDLGVEPGVELRNLHQRILHADPDLLVAQPDGPLPPATTAAPSTTPEPATTAPEPDRGGGIVPAELPPIASGFVGRRHELAELDRMTEAVDDAPPIGVLTGPPGIGKTALALHWAGRQRSRWPDGQLYVDLCGHANAPAVDPIEALTRFLRAIGLPSDRIPSDLAEATSLYRSLTADKRMLILLDNAGGADQVRPLLPGGRGCVVLVTSRDRLTGLTAREGARRLDLDVLPDSDARALLAGIVGADRLDAEPGEANQLAQLCGNLPLALRIAAANLTNEKCQSVAAYVTELCTDRLAALSVDGDDQTAVRTAFSLSYAKLPEPARRMFRLLGLFPGPDVYPDTAGALFGTSVHTARRLLDQLVSAHLATSRDHDRLILHDLLRDYATELVERDEPEAERSVAIQRLYDHYTRTADATARRLYPQIVRLPLSCEASDTPADFETPEQAAAWLESEWSNLIAAVRYAAEHGPYLDACRLAVALRGYLHTKRRLVDWSTVARAGLAAAHTAGNIRAEAAIRLSLADLHRRQNQNRPALGHYGRTLALSRRDSWIEGQSAAHNGLGSLYQLTGRLDLAAEHLERALHLNRSAGWLAAQAANLGNLGSIFVQLGQLDEAIETLRQAIELVARIGAPTNHARTLAKLGEALSTKGHHDAARHALLDALERQQRIGDREYLPFTLCELAAVRLASGELSAATELAHTAHTLASESVGGQDIEAGSLRVLAAIDEATGQYERAQLRYQHASNLARRSGLRYLHVHTLIGLARSSTGLAQTGRARRHTERAIQLARRYGYRLLENQALDIQRTEARAIMARPAVAVRALSGWW